ncbi:hypothetical protein RYJ27_05340 [Microbacterium limosum]|uniref:Uncharacterized protein n=1 Tax=Microbacterium limosum TaxID=3079935 RepID=A0AAU0MIY4_9MICO|nr:hypothetical protein [Microbacterium sp. Y20]WOQ70626.1 hypothetical protein RYJ27_05340 [Microbacterium sp. Y20]
MSTPEQPLTRKQLRELQRTGSVPVQDDAHEEDDVAPAPTPAVPLPRAAVPAAAPPAPRADAEVDLGVAPLTRRQAREQERIRTASIPVITPEQAASRPAHEAPVEDAAVEDAAVEDAAVEDAAVEDAEETAAEETAADETAADETADDQSVEELPGETDAQADADDDSSETGDRVAEDEERESDDAESAVEASPISAAEAASVGTETSEPVPATTAGGERTATDEASADTSAETEGEHRETPTVGPQFGAELLAAEESSITLPPSFDEVVARSSSTGALATPSALILSQTPAAPSLSGPVNATGEVIITGSYHLPEGLGSRGSDPRSTDGKDVDAVLVDGELPASSSPTPIAASAAVSTVRGTGEIIRPPAPEKGSKLLFALAITAGVLALALVGVLIVAVVNGVF